VVVGNSSDGVYIWEFLRPRGKFGVVNIRSAIASATLVLLGCAASAQIQVDKNKWDVGSISGIPLTFDTAPRNISLDRTSPTTRVRLNPSSTTPITFILKAIGTGANINPASEGRFVVVFGVSVDGEDPITNGVWTSTFNTNGLSGKATNWIHGATWPFIHVLSISTLSNSAANVTLSYSQPNGQ